MHRSPPSFVLSALLVLLLGVVSPLLVWGQTSSAPLHGLRRLQVLDANNKEIGFATLHRDSNDTEETAVYFEKDGAIFWLTVRKDGFVQPDTWLAYESTDCTGAPFVFAPASDPLSMWTPVTIGAPGSTLYMPIPGAEPRVIQTHSLYNQLFGCFPDLDQQEFAYPGQAVVDFATLFQTPFRLIPLEAAKQLNAPTAKASSPPPIKKSAKK